MRISWTQPSLSRDFALLAGAILCILLVFSVWITYGAYTRHIQSITIDLDTDAQRIEHTLRKEMENADYLLTALGQQIVIDPNRDLTKLAQILKSFDSKGNIYSIFSWISPNQQVVVSSNHGILEKPVDISDRDYIKKAMAEPWKMHIGKPIEGRVSERWVIPATMGLTDYTGKFIGSIMVSLDINMLTEQLSTLIKRDGLSFAIVSKTLIPLTQVSSDKDFITNNFPTQKLIHINFTDDPSGLIASGRGFLNNQNYAYYRASERYPYIILLTYDASYSNQPMQDQLWIRLLELLGIGAFFVLFLWLMRSRMIHPVLEMTNAIAAVANGADSLPIPQGGPLEIAGLAVQLRRVNEYITETKRIEDELRNKMFLLKKSKEKAELDQHSQSEFIAYLFQEMRHPLNSMIGFSQVMKDQLYGPIENRKYRQYAADIYHVGNGLLNHLQNLQTIAAIETHYVELIEKPVSVAEVITKALQFVNDKMQADHIRTKIRLADGLPKLFADEFRLQQIIMNLFLHILQRILPKGVMLIEAKLIGENRDRCHFAIIISADERYAFSPQEILERYTTSIEHTSAHAQSPFGATTGAINLGLELAKMLLSLHQGWLDIRETNEGVTVAVILLPAHRLRFSEE